MIPKIIHQMGPEDKKEWHSIWEECHQSWREQFPEPFYQHIFWTDDMLRDLVKNDYPQYLEMYEDFPVDVFRIDFSRFCILHKYGGIYADLDFYCYQNFYKELDADIYILESQKEWGEVAQNSLMSSCPQNSFWMLAMEKCKEKYYELVDTDLKGMDYLKSFNEDWDTFSEVVKKITGPLLLSELCEEYQVSLFPKYEYHPFDHYSFYRDGKEKSREKFEELKYKYEVNNKIKCRHFLSGVWGKEIRKIYEMRGQTL